MATFQSQINILAAGQHKLHEKVKTLEDFSLFVKHDSLNTLIKDDNDSNYIMIQDLGNQAYDCILKVIDNNNICLMDYDGNYNCLTGSGDITYTEGFDSKTQCCSLSVTDNSLFIYNKYGESDSALMIFAENPTIGITLGDKLFKYICRTKYESTKTKDVNDDTTEGNTNNAD